MILYGEARNSNPFFHEIVSVSFMPSLLPVNIVHKLLCCVYGSGVSYELEVRKGFFNIMLYCWHDRSKRWTEPAGELKVAAHC